MPTKVVHTVKKPTKPKAELVSKEKYIEAIGRRKTAVARVRLFSGRKAGSKEPELIINEKPFSKYFPLAKLQKTVLSPFEELSLKEYSATALVSGSGPSAQSEAIRLGLSRALTALNPLWRSRLKSLGFLKRDPRKVERKKYGSRKARRPQQWRKR
jgi:small subunit ribosomal protein S9